jgi:UrcA family protein
MEQEIMKSPTLLLSTTIIFTLAGTHVPSAAALPDHQTLTKTIKTFDLDLTRQRDRDALDIRINDAARSLCQWEQHTTKSAELQCRRKSVRSAQRQRNVVIVRALRSVADVRSEIAVENR